jgi:lysophospholipase L1-like esterase
MGLIGKSSQLGAALVLAAVASVGPALAQSTEPVVVQPQNAPARYSCTSPAELTRIDYPLSRTARRLATAQPMKIVAVGSSSTAGAGASSDAMTYPSRLQVELKALFPRVSITVLNRGVGGETAKDMLARFDRDVIDEKPDLVIWQLGSNSILKQLPIAPANTLIRQGVAKLKAANADIILMNPQYAPKVINKPNIDKMVDLINGAAWDLKVNLFQRFAMMRYWRLTEDMPFSAFLSEDELHLNDWSYGCVAKLLADAIEEAATRPTVTAGTTTPRR